MTDFYNSKWINIDGNYIHETAIVQNCKLGTGNRIGPYTCIGTNGEIRGKDANLFEGQIIIGDNNVISEHVTIQRPYERAVTKIGSDNIIMAHSHVGHDVTIGDNCEICTGTIIGGYATIKNGAKLKLGATIRNRITVGLYSLIGLGSSVVKSIGDGQVVYGNPAKEPKESWRKRIKRWTSFFVSLLNFKD